MKELGRRKFPPVLDLGDHIDSIIRKEWDGVFCLHTEHRARGRLAGASNTMVRLFREQAEESFYLWRGVRPDTEPVIRQLRTNHGIK